MLVLLAIRLLVQLFAGVPYAELLLVLVPILFMYAPVWSCQLRGADPWAYPMALPALQDREQFLGALRINLALWAALIVPFVLGYHVWQTMGIPWLQDAIGVRLFRHLPELQWTWPANPLKLVLYHLFYVAIPEEMFYRGYMQSRFDELYPRRWNVLGTLVGPGLLVTCVLFAFGHSIVILQWWHVFIVFPSLVFGWLRERTDGIVAGALFHAWCNVTVAVLDTLYGITPP